MSEFLQGIFDLLGQLIDIGGEHPEVLIATMVLIAGTAITCVLFCGAVALALPFMVVRSIVDFFLWLWGRKHPQYADSLEESEEDWQELQQPTRAKKESHSLQEHKDRKAPKGKPSPDTELPPVLPHWMNQKGGRLL